MLSFNRGRPIALIEDGKYDKKIVHLFDDLKKCCRKCNANGKYGNKKCCEFCDKDNCNSYLDEHNDIKYDLFEVLCEDYIRKFKKKLSVIDLQKLRRAIQLSIKPLEKDLGDIYEKCLLEYNNKSKKELIIYDDGQILPLPNYFKPERTYICGPSDSGKSYYISMYIEQLKKIYPKRDIFLFSDVKEDKVLDNYNPLRISLDEKFLDDEIDSESLKNSIVIFDDIDSISNKKIKQKVSNLRDSLLTRGRHEDISVVVTNHSCTNYGFTKVVLNECNSITFFPKSGSTGGIKYMLTKYVGLDNDQIKKIFSLPSRWITIYKHSPMYIIYEKGIYVL